jgi:hypothetical protein
LRLQTSVESDNHQSAPSQLRIAVASTLSPLRCVACVHPPKGHAMPAPSRRNHTVEARPIQPSSEIPHMTTLCEKRMTPEGVEYCIVSDADSYSRFQ